MVVFSLLDSSPIVLTYRIVDFKFWETGSYVKMQIVLIDNSVLHVREYNDEFERNYSFHWQDSQGAFIELTPSLAIEASKLSLHHSLPMADSIILATAKKYDCTIWTQDADFKDIKGANYFVKKNK